MSKFKNWLLHNTVLKFFSVAAAFVIWILVANYSNPEVFETVEVNLQTYNSSHLSSQDRIYSLSADKVEITYKIRSKQREMAKPSDFHAYIDYDEMSESGTQTLLKVHVENSPSLDGYISDISIYPININVTTEKIQQKKFAVECMIEGDVKDGFYEGEIELSPEYIYVKGPVSAIGQISSAGIAIDVDNLSSTTDGVSQVMFFDENGNVLNGISDKLSFAGDISYTVPVYRTKSLSVNAFAGGMPASGYVVDRVETSPTFISVYGEDDVLNSHSYIIIPGSDLNVSGVSENVTKNLNVTKYLPEGLNLVQANPEITVYVKIRSIYEKEGETQTEPAAAPVVSLPEIQAPETAPPEETAPSIPEEIPSEEHFEETEEYSEEEISGEDIVYEDPEDPYEEETEESDETTPSVITLPTDESSDEELSDD